MYAANYLPQARSDSQQNKSIIPHQCIRPGVHDQWLYSHRVDTESVCCDTLLYSPGHPYRQKNDQATTLVLWTLTQPVSVRWLALQCSPLLQPKCDQATVLVLWTLTRSACFDTVPLLLPRTFGCDISFINCNWFSTVPHLLPKTFRPRCQWQSDPVTTNVQTTLSVTVRSCHHKRSDHSVSDSPILSPKTFRPRCQWQSDSITKNVQTTLSVTVRFYHHKRTDHAVSDSPILSPQTFRPRCQWQSYSITINVQTTLTVTVQFCHHKRSENPVSDSHILSPQTYRPLCQWQSDSITTNVQGTISVLWNVKGVACCYRIP